MNINDLKPNDYKVVGLPQQGKLNINNLPKDSYTTVPEKSFGEKALGVAKDVGKSIERPFVSLAAIPTQGVAKLLGQPDPFATFDKQTGLAPVTSSDQSIGDYAKQNAGNALEVGSYVAGGPEVAGGAKALTSGKLLTQGLGKSFLQGGKAIAPSFAMQAGGQSMATPGTTFGENLGDAAKGYATGFGTGGLFGVGGKVLENTGIGNKLFKGATGRAENKAVQNAEKSAKNFDKNLAMTRDDLTSGVTAAGDKNIITGGEAEQFKKGNTTDTGLFTSAESLPTEKDIARQKAVDQYIGDINVAKNPEQATQRLNQVEKEFGDNKMNPFLENQEKIIRAKDEGINFKDMHDYLENGSNAMLDEFGIKSAPDETTRAMIKRTEDMMDEIRAKNGDPRDFYSKKTINEARKKIDTLVKDMDAKALSPNTKISKNSVVSTGEYLRNALNRLNEESILYGDIGKVNKYKQAIQDFGPIRLEGTPNSYRDAALLEHFGIKTTPESIRAADEFVRLRKHQQHILEARNNIALNNFKKSKTTGGQVGQFMKNNPNARRVINAAKVAGTLGGLRALYNSAK